MKLLKASFLLAAAANAPPIAHADIIDIAPAPSGYMMDYDQIIANPAATALIANAFMSSDYVFWTATTGRLTGSADALTVPDATSYYLQGLNQSGSKIYGRAYNATAGTYDAVIWNPAAGTYVKPLAALTYASNGSFGSRTITADFNRAYGTYNQGGVNKVFRWDAISGVTPDLIGSLNLTNSNCGVSLMSADGNAVAGYYYPGNSQTFYWSQAAGAIDIGASMGWAPSNQVTPGLMNSDGAYLFVSKMDASYNYSYFRWKSADNTSIELIKPAGANSLQMVICSSDGNTAFGTYHDGYTKLFKWTATGGMNANLAPAFSSATTLYGASTDLRYLYGYFNSGADYHTFRYDDVTTTSLDLNAGQSGYFFPKAISSNGNFVVGQKDYNTAWRWSDTDGYQTISTWLLANGSDPTVIGNWIFKNANSVSDDGNTVIGLGTLSGTSRYFIASATSGVADYEVWLSSINGQHRVYNAGSTLAGLPLEGAHHRPMLSFDRMGKESQAWATGDFGSSSRTRDVHVTTGEAGINWNVGKTGLIGFAVGHGIQNQDLALNGSSATKGDFALLEYDYRPEGTQWIVSLIGMVGSWESKTNRGYDNGAGTDYSFGVSDTITRSARFRVDAPAVATFGGFGFAPYASYTVTQTVVGAYTETGGGFPATFDEQSHNATEARLGVTASKDLSEKTKLLLSVEGIHRFDGVGPALTGQDVTGGVSFSLPGVAPRPDCVRFGFDVDHKLSADTLLNISAHASTVGEAHDVSAAISIRRAF